MPPASSQRLRCGAHFSSERNSSTGMAVSVWKWAVPRAASSTETRAIDLLVGGLDDVHEVVGPEHRPLLDDPRPHLLDLGVHLQQALGVGLEGPDAVRAERAEEDVGRHFRSFSPLTGTGRAYHPAGAEPAAQVAPDQLAQLADVVAEVVAQLGRELRGRSRAGGSPGGCRGGPARARRGARRPRRASRPGRRPPAAAGGRWVNRATAPARWTLFSLTRGNRRGRRRGAPRNSSVRR